MNKVYEIINLLNTSKDSLQKLIQVDGELLFFDISDENDLALIIASDLIGISTGFTEEINILLDEDGILIFNSYIPKEEFDDLKNNTIESLVLSYGRDVNFDDSIIISLKKYVENDFNIPE